MIYNADKWLKPYRKAIDARHSRILEARDHFSVDGSLSAGINNHFYYGMHRTADGWVFREWAPNATRIYLVGDFNGWHRTEGYALKPVGGGNWEITIPAMFIHHGDLYRLYIEWSGGGAERLPAYVRRTVQDNETKQFSAQVWEPAQKYSWKHKRPGRKLNPLIYECHIGMSGDREGVSTFNSFRTEVLPRVAALGYNVIQIMALQEHPYYGSFGYQVSNFFALSSRFGTPEEFKALVDEAHAKGIAVVMDLVHSHMVKNEAESLSNFDGREDLYFYTGWQGHHPAWDSRCFDYGKDETRCFLLSNCKFWMEEYMLDGFRFDGVTSMMYWDHGLGKTFGDYKLYFDQGVDESAVTYLGLANILIHELCPEAITIAEDVSGMAGLAAPLKAGGVGFDFRMSMGVADHWIKWIKERTDDQWSMGEIWYELTNKRADERTISYAECHDQAMVGDKTIAMRLIDAKMYTSMNVDSHDADVDRGIALHKLIRLATIGTAGNGYLNFMGNEMGHPEWIDFPREGNGWSYAYARRQWSLDKPWLRYSQLRNFDEAMIHYVRKYRCLSAKPKSILCDEEKKVLIFSRKKCIFALNFNPTVSFSDFGFKAEDGKYVAELVTDMPEFGGFSRVTAGGEHFTQDGILKVYLPARSAIVLTKKD